MPRKASSRDSKLRKQEVVAEFRRAEILEAAVTVFGEKGFDATHIADIAKAAQLAKGTVYSYFASKDEIYQAAVQDAFARITTLTDEHVRREEGFRNKLLAFVRVRLEFWTEQQERYRMILGWSHNDDHRKRKLDWQTGTSNYLAAIFAEAGKTGEIPEQDFSKAAWAMMDLIRGFNERRSFSREESIEDETRFLVAFLLYAVQARE